MNRVRRWQYTCLQVTADEPLDLALLNEIGGLGWEMTGVIRYPDTGLQEYYFKRLLT